MGLLLSGKNFRPSEVHTSTMTAGAQNVKKEMVNEGQSRGQNNGGQTRQRFTGGDVRTAQRRVERRSTALGIRRVQTKTPRDRRTARRAGAGTKGRQTQVWARAEANCASGLAAAAGAQSRAAALGNVPAISHQAKQTLRPSAT